MHGLCRAIAAGVPFDFGRVFLVHPMRLVDWGVCENVLLANWQDAFEFAVSSRLELGKELKPVLREACKQKNYVSFEDVNDFIDTPNGTVLTAWLCCRGELKHQECEEWYQSSKESEVNRFRQLRNQVSCVDLMSGMDWPLSLETHDRKVNWMSRVRAVGEVICPGMSPQQVGELTLYQLRMLSCEAKELEGTVTIPASELKEYKRRRAEAEERAFI